jgi:molybdopterin-guanine dinucleotide biosynthesis protein MobB
MPNSLAEMTDTNLPAFGICGWSGSGKTMLIEELAHRLTSRGLKIAAIKHASHGFDVAGAEKDSNRCFRGGADILLTGPGGSYFWSHKAESLVETIRRLAPEYDLILVEGFKSVPLPRKVWLGDACPPEAGPFTCTLGSNVDRVGIVLKMVLDWLDHLAISTPVYAGILFGGASSRMGEPKHLIYHEGITWLERASQALDPAVNQTVLLGRGEIPASLKSLVVLPDIKDKQGPLAGMLAAMRWHPRASWLFVACDLPNISTDAIRWLLSMRMPGVWATMPRLGAEGVEPLLAHYDYRARPLLEFCLRPSEIAQMPQVRQPVPPAEIAEAWINANTPADRACI